MDKVVCPVCHQVMAVRVAQNGTRTYECRVTSSEEYPTHNATVIIPQPKRKKSDG